MATTSLQVHFAALSGIFITCGDIEVNNIPAEVN